MKKIFLFLSIQTLFLASIQSQITYDYFNDLFKHVCHYKTNGSEPKSSGTKIDIVTPCQFQKSESKYPHTLQIFNLWNNSKMIFGIEVVILKLDVVPSSEALDFLMSNDVTPADGHRISLDKLSINGFPAKHCVFSKISSNGTSIFDTYATYYRDKMICISYIYYGSTNYNTTKLEYDYIKPLIYKLWKQTSFI